MSEREQALFDRYTSEFKLNNMVADILARDEKLSSFYEEALSLHNAPLTIANIVANEVARELKEKDIGAIKFGGAQIAELAKMVDEGTISNKIAKEVFEEMAENGANPSDIVASKGLVQINDPTLLEPIIDEIIAKNKDNVEKFKAGNTKLFGFFVGQVLKATEGRANPQVVNTLVSEKLK